MAKETEPKADLPANTGGELSGQSETNNGDALLSFTSGIALLFLRKRLQEGKSVEIPSLNIVIPGKAKENGSKNGNHGK